MMEFITAPTIIGIITLGFYKLFELFVCKKERMLMIEKLGDKLSLDILKDKISLPTVGNLSFSALKFGCLFMGLGLGLLAGYLICATTIEGYSEVKRFTSTYEIVSIIYGACVLLFGGLGLLIAFLVELKINKK